MQISYAQWTQIGTSGYYYLNSGHVAIGTSTTSATDWFTVQDAIRVSLSGGYGGYYGYDASTGGNNIFSLTRQTNNLAICAWNGIGFTANSSGPNTAYNMFIHPSGYVGIGTTSPDERLVVNGNLEVVLDPSAFSAINVSKIVSLGYSGITGARNWAIRGVYQYANGVGLNANGGDLDIIKSLDGNTILCTKTNGSALGNVLIGKTTQANSGYMLDVNGNVRANQVVINSTGADFVFAPTYKLNSLSYLKKYISQNHHLPEMPSAKQMQADGLNVGDNQTKLLQKVEELTLYLIDLKKSNDEMKKEIAALKNSQKATNQTLKQINKKK